MEKSNQTSSSRLKSITLLSILIMAFACATPSTTVSSNPRIISVNAQNSGQQYRITVNKRTSIEASNTAFTNAVSSLKLKHGDIVIMNGSLTEDIYQCLKSYSDSNHVAVYAPSKSEARYIGQIPTYHWVTPFSNPREIARATFFKEGSPLGAATDGFEAMLNDIAASHPTHIFLLGALYDRTAGFGFLETPFEDRMATLNEVLLRVGTVAIRLDPID